MSKLSFRKVKKRWNLCGWYFCKALVIPGYSHNTRLEELSYEDLQVHFIEKIEKVNTANTLYPYT